MKLTQKQIRIAIIAATESEDLEVIVPYDLWRRAKIHTEIISIEKKNSIILAHGVTLKCHEIIDKTNLFQYDAIYLPGGPGFSKFLANEKLRKILIKFAKNKKWLLGLCGAPVVFYHLDILEKNKIACHPEVAKIEKLDKSPNYSKLPIVVSGSFITGDSPGAAFTFALTVIENLLGKKESNEIKKQILYK